MQNKGHFVSQQSCVTAGNRICEPHPALRTGFQPRCSPTYLAHLSVRISILSTDTDNGRHLITFCHLMLPKMSRLLNINSLLITEQDTKVNLSMEEL